MGRSPEKRWASVIPSHVFELHFWRRLNSFFILLMFTLIRKHDNCDVASLYFSCIIDNTPDRCHSGK
ncbi:hypothetical protein CSPX01_06622 [Colletotrichum filicis]|nr:hypothetical protein CSPX01_06622 [Colletotrichum filicis]